VEIHKLHTLPPKIVFEDVHDGRLGIDISVRDDCCGIIKDKVSVKSIGENDAGQANNLQEKVLNNMKMQSSMKWAKKIPQKQQSSRRNVSSFQLNLPFPNVLFLTSESRERKQKVTVWWI